MALQKQNVPISFKRGLDSKTDPKQVVPGKLLALTNGTFITTDRIDKRQGYTEYAHTYSGGGTITNGVGVASYKNELTMLDGSQLLSYSPSEAQWSQVTGLIEPTAVTTTPIYQASASQSSADSSFHAGSGLQCFVSTSTFGFSFSNPVVYTVVDTVSGQKLVSGAVVPSSTSAGTMVKVVTFGSYFVIVFYASGGTALSYCTVPVATPSAISAAVLLANDVLTAHANFDVAVISTRLFVAYNSSGGGNSVHTFYLDAAFTKTSGAAVAHDANGAITIFGDPSLNAWVVYSNDAGSNLRGFVFNFNLSGFTLADQVVTSGTSAVNITASFVAGAGTTTAQLFWEFVDIYLDDVYTQTLTVAGAIGSASIIARNVGLGGKSFAYGGINYVLTTYQGSAVQSAPQQTYFLITTAGKVVAKFMPTSGGGYTLRHLSEVNNLAAGVYQYGLLQVSEAGLFSGLNFNIYGVSSSTVTFGAIAASVELANSLHVSGGFLSVYDGAQVAEHGFHLYPEIVNSSVSDTAITGTYSWVVCYEWVDNQGQTHRSAPSLPLTRTVANKAVTLNISALSLTSKTSGSTPTGAISIGIYRTLDAGTIYYRVTDILNPVSNDTTASTLTFIDTSPDGSIQGNGTLYTTDGEVDNSPIPAPLFLTSYKQRMIAVPAETPTSWWYSKQIVPGSPVEFSDLFVQNEDQRGGGFLAGGQLDDKLVLFKENTLGYVVGDGPAPNGSGNDFTPWQIVQSDTGCNNAASVVAMPDGLMYQSPKGIYLLDRSMKDHYIGGDVEAYNSYTVTSALRVDGTTQVRFTLSNGTALVYDYADTVKDERGYGQWSVFTGISAVAATNYNGNYTYISSAGRVRTEAPGVYTDAGAFIQLSLTTSWLSLAGLQGFQRVYSSEILGQYQSPHHLNVQVAYDFDPTVVQTDDIVGTSVAPYQYRVDFARQKCEAIQLTLKDTQASGFGQGLSLSALTLQVGSKGGLNRLSQTRNYG